jgi:hypothetical protein
MIVGLVTPVDGSVKDEFSLVIDRTSRIGHTKVRCLVTRREVASVSTTMQFIYERRKSIVSHLVSMKTEIHEVAAIEAACRRLGLPAPAQGTARLYSSQATGVIVQLPGWTYPAVIDVQSGNIAYDNFGGRWGDQAQLGKLQQAYAVELAKIECRRQGHVCSEQLLADGSIKVAIEVA